MQNKKEVFSYTYSAAQREEVRRIRQKYMPLEADKMEQLRKLDEQATRPGKLIALIMGIVSALILGIGMCCTMLWTQYFVLGIVVGTLGIAGVCLTYPVYCMLTKRQRERLAPEILRLSDELMGDA